MKNIDYLKKLKNVVIRKNKNNMILNEQANDGKMDLFVMIYDFFKSNPKPTDEDIESFANELEIDDDILEEYIFEMLGDLLTEGRSKNFNGNYDPFQLRMGIEVEFEHTTIPLIAKKIAMDHLAEIPDYYDRLKIMEEEAERNLKK